MRIVEVPVSYRPRSKEKARRSALRDWFIGMRTFFRFRNGLTRHAATRYDTLTVPFSIHRLEERGLAVELAPCLPDRRRTSSLVHVQVIDAQPSGDGGRFGRIRRREHRAGLVPTARRIREAAAARSAGPPPSGGRRTTESASSARARAPSAPSARCRPARCCADPGERLLLIRRGPQRPSKSRPGPAVPDVLGVARVDDRRRQSGQQDHRPRAPAAARGQPGEHRASRTGIETSRDLAGAKADPGRFGDRGRNTAGRGRRRCPERRARRPACRVAHARRTQAWQGRNQHRADRQQQREDGVVPREPVEAEVERGAGALRDLADRAPADSERHGHGRERVPRQMPCARRRRAQRVERMSDP